MTVFFAGGALASSVLVGMSSPGYAATDSDPEPVRQLSGAVTGLFRPTGIALDSTGRLHVSNRLDNSVTVYASDWASGATPPIKTLKGPNTLLAAPREIAFDSAGLMYVVSSDSVLVFARDWSSGNTAPVKSLRGANTGLVDPRGIAFDSSDRMYIVNSYETQSFSSGQRVGSITVYEPNWRGGDTRPVAELTGPATFLDRPYGMAFDAVGRTYVANNDSITVYNYSWAGGDVAPIARLMGSATGLSRPMDIVFDENNIMYVANAGNSTITTYDADWGTLNSPPASVLSGGRTQLVGPAALALSEAGHVYAANEVADKITEHVPSRVDVILTAVGAIPLRSYNSFLFPINVELRASPVTVTARSSLISSPTRVTSLTPNVCEGEGYGAANLVLKRTGACTVKAEVAVDEAWSVSPVLTRTFYVVRSSQSVTVPTVPATPVTTKWVSVRATSSSGLPVIIYSLSPAVCLPSFAFGARVRLLTAGTCSLVGAQPGNEFWNGAQSSVTFEVLREGEPVVKPALQASCNKIGSGGGAVIKCLGTSQGVPEGTELVAYTRPTSNSPWGVTPGLSPIRVDAAGRFEWQTRAGAQPRMSVYFAYGAHKSPTVIVRLR